MLKILGSFVWQVTHLATLVVQRRLALSRQRCFKLYIDDIIRQTPELNQVTMTDYAKALVTSLISLATFVCQSYRHAVIIITRDVIPWLFWDTPTCLRHYSLRLFLVVLYIPSTIIGVPGDVRSQHPGHRRDAAKSSLRRRLCSEDHGVTGCLWHHQRYRIRLSCWCGVVTTARRTSSDVVAQST